MRWNLGSSAWPGRANSARGPRVAHSNPPRPSETEKLMFDGWERDAELGEHALEVRVVALVEDDEAGVDGPAGRPAVSTSTVFVWPPA